MESFTKYYSYNQLIEEHDILVMTEQEYLTNKDQLDNPQRIVLVNREGGPKEPKIPKWFQSYKKEADARFEKIEEKIEKIEEKIEKIEEKIEKIEEKIEKIETKLDDSKPPKWFTTYMANFRVEVGQMIDSKLKAFAKLNNLKYEE